MSNRPFTLLFFFLSTFYFRQNYHGVEEPDEACAKLGIVTEPDRYLGRGLFGFNQKPH